jgi:DNA polymerase-4
MGERFWYGLHGIDPPDLPPSPKQSIGHSHVLGHRLRNAADAHLVGRRLLARAAARLRRAGLLAGGLSLYVRMVDAPSRDAALRFDLSDDTFHLMTMYERLWQGLVRPGETLRPMHVGVTFFGLMPLSQTPPPDLFGWSAQATQNPRHVKLSAALDSLNQRYGSETVAIGPAPKGLSHYMGAKIAFNRVPDREDFRG